MKSSKAPTRARPISCAAYREFLAKVEASGPDTLAFVYFSGHALSFDGENFLLGVDARLARDSDIPIESVRLSDLLRSARRLAGARQGDDDRRRASAAVPAAGQGACAGLEAIEPPQGMLIAYSSAPGTVAPDRPGDYGAYATAIAEMLRAPGIDLETAFTHIRSRTHQTTEGQQTPWHVSALGEPIELVPPEAATASVPPPPPIRQARPMREIGPDEAYALAIEMDTLEGYTAFVAGLSRPSLHAAGLGDDPRAPRGAGLDARAARSTRRDPTGPICAAIRTACTPSTPSAVCAGSGSRSRRRRASP